MDIWKTIKVIRARPAYFLMLSLVGFLIALVGPSLLSKPLQIFKSTAKILITPNTNSVSTTERTVDPSVRAWFTDESTLRALLSSQDLLEVVLDAAGSKLTWLDLRERIDIEILSNSGQQVSLLEISILGEKPEETRQLALSLSEKFIQYVQQLSAAEHDKTVSFLERERRNAEREVARAQKRLLKIGILPASAGGSSALDNSLNQAQKQRDEYELELARAQSEMEALEITEATGGSVKDGVVGNDLLSQEVAKEQLKLAELRETYTDKSPQVQAQLERLRRKAAVRQTAMAQSLNRSMQASRDKVRRLQGLLRQKETEIRKFNAQRPGPEKHLAYATEERQLQMWQENYLDLTKQLYRARVQQQSSRRDGAFTIVEKPLKGRQVAGELVGKSMAVRVLLALPVGFVLGFVMLMASDYFNTSMRLEPRIEEALGLPILGSVPVLPDDSKSNWDHMKQNLRRPGAKT